jgi:hypothetical protein
MTTTKLRQHSSGTFSVPIIPTTKHCGIDDSTGVFRYQVDIVYRSESALDQDRFLLDNLTFRRYFCSLPPVDCSCEELTLRAREHFRNALSDRLQHVEAISVRVYPFEDTYVASEEILN